MAKRKIPDAAGIQVVQGAVLGASALLGRREKIRERKPCTPLRSI